MITPLTEPPAANRGSSRKRVLRGGLVLVAGLLVATVSVPAFATDTSAGSGGSAGSSAESSDTPYLPRPTGQYPVGTTSVYLTDDSRPDPWVPEVTARELMVSLWYPAKRSNGQRAQYMTPTESELLLTDADITGVPLDVLSTTRTNAVTDATPVRRPHGLPLVVLSPGYTKPRATLTSLAEDLASHGYVVAVIDHTYENVATTFPDGRVTTCASCEEDHDDTFWRRVQTGRATDVSFVLDELTGPHARWKAARLIDPRRIAMAGHSVGGASSITAMLADSRIRAGIDIDGTTNVPIPDTGLSRPFLFLGRESQYTPGSGDAAATWERDWAHLTGWKRWLVVTGTEHASFTDIGLLAEQAGIDTGATLPAARTAQITRTYTRAFFDQHLRDTPQPLLNQPSTRYPEVKFCSVSTASCG